MYTSCFWQQVWAEGWPVSNAALVAGSPPLGGSVSGIPVPECLQVTGRWTACLLKDAGLRLELSTYVLKLKVGNSLPTTVLSTEKKRMTETLEGFSWLSVVCQPHPLGCGEEKIRCYFSAYVKEGILVLPQTT